MYPACATGSEDPGPPYGGSNINHNSMQLSASVNPFGIERITKQTTDKFGNLIEDKNETAAKKWVIQSKFETPMMNFTDEDPVHPIKPQGVPLPITLPTYGSSSVPTRNVASVWCITIYDGYGNIPFNWRYRYKLAEISL